MKTALTVLLIMEFCQLSFCLIKQHFFVDQRKSWTDAQQYCKTHFYDLSSFTNESEELQFLEDAVGQTYNGWIGLKKDNSGIWKWSGGENATRISWDTLMSQPDNNDCAFLYTVHKKLHDEQCSNELAFFCMTLSEFVLVPQNQSWEGALDYCRNHYTDLASLSSKSRMDSALEKISNAQTDHVWTGLRFLAGEWFWVSGEDLDYQAWSSAGQPQCPASNLRCGALDKNKEIWTHRGCEESFNFFCSAQSDGTSFVQSFGSPNYTNSNDRYDRNSWWGGGSWPFWG